VREGPPRRLRRAARIVLLDGAGRVLLFRFTPEGWEPFWVLPGGECEPDEDYAEAARRELFEETGIRGAPTPMDHVKQSEYEYLGEPVRSVEHFFHWRTARAEIDIAGHTDIERAMMLDHRWFAPHELASWPETIWPRDLGALIAALAPAAAAR
jgi:8-oxo-dGTP pyrophosphatase MutT (NUDIX family)